MSKHAEEIQTGRRFAFGSNWKQYQRLLDEERIQAARESLKEMFRVDTLQNATFLDVGSGSGLFSLAARQLGAKVASFDYDPDSVACTSALKDQFFPNDTDWSIQPGSILDTNFLKTLPQFDYVYSWGVLHHTGAMWSALENISPLVQPGGKLFIAIYNDEGLCSRYWHQVKKTYVRFPVLRIPIILLHTIYPFLPSRIYRALTGRLKRERGMSAWYDLIDWVGGYPFEVASVRDLFEFYRTRGYVLDNIRTTNRSGCNEMVFIKKG